MALATSAIIGLCVLGGTVLSSAVTAGIYIGTSDEREQNENIRKINEYRKNIEAQQKMIEDFTVLKNNLGDANMYLDYGKINFQDGGHVLNGVPLANLEFNSCLENINNAITGIDTFITDLNSSVTAMQSEVEKLLNRNIEIEKKLQKKQIN